MSPTVTRGFEDFLSKELDTLLKFLHGHVRSLDFNCRIRWEKSYVVVWDQRSLAYSAVPGF